MTETGTVILGGDLAEERAYWQRKLSGEMPLAGLPEDLPGPATGAPADRVDFELPSDLAGRLVELGGGNDTRIFVALLAAVEICLARYAGSEDVVVGTAIHQRHQETATLNRVVVLRDRVDPRARMRDFVDSVRQTVAEAYRHQKFPHERLARLVRLGTSNRRAPFFKVAVLLDAIHDRGNLDDATPEAVVTWRRTADGIAATVEYDGGLIHRAAVESFRAHLVRVLSRLVEAPDGTVGELELSSDESRRRRVEAFNATRADYPREKTLHELFEERAARDAAEVAVSHGDRVLTYREVDERAERLARVLRREGARPGERVAVYMDHSPDVVVALLAVLKSGAAFVPLDPFHPVERTATMIADAAPVAVLTDSAFLDRFAGKPLRVLVVDDLGSAPGETAGTEGPAATPDHLAYVIFTSGSTGRPKGVEITHRAAVNYLWWAMRTYVRVERPVFPLYSSLAFDLTLTSVFVPLLSGGQVRAYSQTSEGFSLLDVTADDRVDVLKATPSHLALLAEGRGMLKLRTAIVGGEAFETRLAAAARASLGEELTLFNEYGPTEATVGCMLHRFDPDADRGVLVPIGTPAANGRVYVLDPELRPVAENVLGEIHIAGDGLARGYRGLPGRTAASFLPDPFGGAGERMYRTGDLARWHSGDLLDFAGRVDDQVKFHGYRVELGELRNCLNQHPKVRDSHVTMLRDEQGYDTLVAYYVARQELDVTELRSAMARMVLEETIPNYFVHMRAFPLTLNGKVNYAAFPSLADAKARVQREHSPPTTPTEEILATIWEEVLGVQRLGVHDNFFALGGHSLMATQVISRIRSSFGVELPIRALFDLPTVAALAEEVTRHELAAADDDELAALVDEISQLGDAGGEDAPEDRP